MAKYFPEINSYSLFDVLMKSVANSKKKKGFFTPRAIYSSSPDVSNKKVGQSNKVCKSPRTEILNQELIFVSAFRL